MCLAVKDIELCSVKGKPILQKTDHIVLCEAGKHHQRLVLKFAKELLPLQLIFFFG
jgi:hypothetical protein